MATTEDMMAEATKNLQKSQKGGVEKPIDNPPPEPAGEENPENEEGQDTLIDTLPEEQQEAAKGIIDKIKEDNKDADDKKIAELLKKELDTKPEKEKEEEQPETPDINTLLSTHSQEKYKNIDELIKKAEDKPDITKEISEKTEGKYTSVDELYKATQANPFASDRIKKLNELEKQGVDITKILSFDSMGIDKLNPENREDALQLLRNKLRTDEPDITEREINFELSKYDTSDEDMEDSEKESINMRLSRNAKAAKRELENTKKKYELPENKPVLPDTKELDELKNKWKSNVSEALDGYTFEEFDLNGQGKIKYTVKESEVKTLREVMDNPDQFLKRYINNGKTDMVRFRKEMMFLLNQNKVGSIIYEQGKSVGAEELVKSIHNYKPEASSAAPAEETADTPEKAAAKNMVEEGL